VASKSSALYRSEESEPSVLILGASAVIRQACLRGAPALSWLAQMLPRNPKMLVTVAFANKMARVVWALLVKGGVYEAPAVAA
jgi:transposase